MRLNIKVCYIVAVQIIWNCWSISICSAQSQSGQAYITTAKEYYQQQNWKQAARYYNKYLKYAEKIDKSHEEALYILADIYYVHLKRYNPALEIYDKLADNGPLHKDVRKRFLQLKKDRDRDGYCYAREHDLGLSDTVPILTELNKFFPQQCSITYVKKGGISGGLLKYFKFVNDNKEVNILDNKDQRIGELVFKNFLSIWVDLLLLEPEDIPEDNVIFYDIQNGEKILKSPSPMISDTSRIEILMSADNKVKKLLIIEPVELTSDKLHKVVQLLEEKAP